MGVDALFIPNEKIIYPDGFSTYVEEGILSKGLEGGSRPHFFKGVLTVVLKLFNIIYPQYVFFGKKDYQQLRLIQKMVKDLDLNIHVIGCETIREAGGLALSSRNGVFSSKEKEDLNVIYDSLSSAKNEIMSGQIDSSFIRSFIKKRLLSLRGIEVDYIKVTDIRHLVSVEKIQQDSLISLAVFFKNVRLIDNIEVKI
jgi:pantoate--beta-alanine ligase